MPQIYIYETVGTAHCLPAYKGILKTLSLGSLEGCAMKPTQMFEKAQGLLLPEKQLKIYKNCTTGISYMYKDDFYFLKCI